MPRLLLGSILMVLTATFGVGAEPPTIVVEDWSRQPLGRSGIPDG